MENRQIIKELEELLIKLSEVQADDNQLTGPKRGEFLNKQMAFARSEYEDMTNVELLQYLDHKKVTLDKKLQNLICASSNIPQLAVDKLHFKAEEGKQIFKFHFKD